MHLNNIKNILSNITYVEENTISNLKFNNIIKKLENGNLNSFKKLFPNCSSFIEITQKSHIEKGVGMNVDTNWVRNRCKLITEIKYQILDDEYDCIRLNLKYKDYWNSCLIPAIPLKPNVLTKFFKSIDVSNNSLKSSEFKSLFPNCQSIKKVASLKNNIEIVHPIWLGVNARRITRMMYTESDSTSFQIHIKGEGDKLLSI